MNPKRPHTASQATCPVLDHAAARRWRTGENPAQWRGHLANMLPARAKVAHVEHRAALPWRQTADFLRALGDREAGSVSALALRFTILTAARSGEVLGARWDEIDFTETVWTVPGKRMKAGREHRTPLSPSALVVLRQAVELRTSKAVDTPVFPSQNPARGCP